MPELMVLFRHGEAADAPSGGMDADRPLTDAGRRQVGVVAAALRRLFPETLPGAVLLPSPLQRAPQTADIMAGALGLPVLGPETALAPDLPPEDMLDTLAGLADERPWLIGHQPQLGRLIRLLTGARLAVGKASATALHPPLIPARATLLWSMPAEALERVGA
jgi:phosphohistidine phosphatase